MLHVQPSDAGEILTSITSKPRWDSRVRVRVRGSGQPPASPVPVERGRERESPSSLDNDELTVVVPGRSYSLYFSE